MTYFAIITKSNDSQQPAVIQNVTSKEAAGRMCYMYFDEDIEVEVFDEDEILFARA